MMWYIPSQDHDFRISMENLRLRDDCQMEEHTQKVIKFL